MGATGIILVLVGNKADLTDQREVSREVREATLRASCRPARSHGRCLPLRTTRATQRAEAVAAEQNMLYLETSAKDGSNVTEVFEAIGALGCRCLFLARSHTRSSREGA